jgi:thymidylate synthase
MLETGQPLHYYDADRLGDTLIVRNAQNDEKLTTLDGNERILAETDIVIANNEGAVGLAGVMGGLSTEVENDTKNIIIEAAIFDSIKIRKTSKKILRSESSNRFEKGLDPKRTYMAIERSCALLEKYANAELRWYWSGDNSCHTIGQYAKMWLRLTDDGETNNSAYGYILFKKYGFNQLEQIIELLQKDSTTRRAVLNISDPAINRITTKDMQCTIALDFLIRDGKLEETVVMRSNDIVKGFTYDYIFFVSIGEYIAKRLGLKLSVYTHHAISMHLYHSDIGTFINVPESDEITHDKYLINADEIIKECYDYEKNNTN